MRNASIKYIKNIIREVVNSSESISEIMRTGSQWKTQEAGDDFFLSNYKTKPEAYSAAIKIDDLSLFYDEMDFKTDSVTRFLIYKNDKLIGLVALIAYKKGYKITNLYIISSYRGQGIALKIYKYFINKKPLYSDDIQSQEARALWMKLWHISHVYGFNKKTNQYFEVTPDEQKRELVPESPTDTLYNFTGNEIELIASNTSLLSESLWLKNKILNILLEADVYANSTNRVKFSIAMMKQAIEEGRELGISYQSEGMPVTKYRIIHPTTMGYGSGTGNLLVRAVHITGQSEKQARATGVRSAEVQNTWRLFKESNIKSMFFTGNFFSSVPGDYSPRDHAMNRIISFFDAAKAKKFQNSLQQTQPEPNVNVTPGQQNTNTIKPKPGEKPNNGDIIK